MHRTLAPTLLVLAVACYEGAEAPVQPTSTASNDLRILGGAVECEACSELEFSIGGPDLQWVVSASFVGSDDARLAPRMKVELRRFTGDSGVVLQARATFMDSLPVGDYDLRLLTPGRAGAESMTLERALRVTRAAAPTGSTPPSQPPGPPAPPAPPPPPPPPGPPVPPPPSGRLRLSVTVGGADLDSRFRAHASECYEHYDYYDHCYGGEVSAGGSLLVTIPAGAQRFTLHDVARNCVVTSPNPATVVVVADSTVELLFTVSCVALGFVEVSVPVSGSENVQQDFTVSCTVGDCGHTQVRAPGPVRLALAPGAYIFTLPPWTLQTNCHLSGPSTIAVQVSSGATAQISLPVTCLPFGEIRVSVIAADPTHSYRVQYPSGCDDYYYDCFTLPVRPGFPALVRGPGGMYTLTLLDVPANCRVMGQNPAHVAVTSAMTTELAFEVACQ